MRGQTVTLLARCAASTSYRGAPRLREVSNGVAEIWVDSGAVRHTSRAPVVYARSLSDGVSLQRHFASAAALAQVEQPASSGLQLTDNAVQRLRELQLESPDQPLYLRLTVEGGGCSGFQYEFSLGSSRKSDDKVFEREGARVLSDTLSLNFLKGAVVDFETDLMRSGFVVAGNPNAASSCGCGSSFVAK